jgi:hypothetical protein
MSTELSTHRASGLALATFDDAFRFAKMVSQSDFAPKDFRGKPDSCLLAIQHGSEIGLSPMQSLQSIAVINGRPTIWGDAALALVQSSPACEYVKEYIEGDGDQAVAVCEVKRRGYPAATISTFSMFDAKRAGLAGKSGPWTQYPARMLALRARGFALRNAFADALRGLVTAEEAQDYPQGEAARVPAREPVVSGPAAPALTLSMTKDDPMTKARHAVLLARSVPELNKLRSLVQKRRNEGTFTEEQHRELVELMIGKAELLPDDDTGLAFEHEAAQHEVTA